MMTLLKRGRDRWSTLFQLDDLWKPGDPPDDQWIDNNKWRDYN